MNYERLINEAIKKIQEIPANEPFELSDLFEDDVWRNLGNYRGSFGKKFRETIEDKDELGIIRVEIAKRQSNVYLKTK